jgi:N-acetylglutamate synthase-like GNAT family acetyltransferase
MPQRALEASDAVGVAGVRLRAATPADVDALVPMINAAYDRTEHHVFPGTRRAERHDISQMVGGIVIAEQNERIAGCIHIDVSGDPAHYGLLAVDVSLHRSGIGSILVEHAELVARGAGATAIRIETVKQAGMIPFYAQRGYCIVQETDGQVWNGGADWGAAGPWEMVDMEKSLR